VLAKYKVEVTFLPAAIGGDIERYLKTNTKAIFLESPGSNTFEIQDIRAITAIAGARNIVTMLDNTWATPLYLKPLELGVDISIQSATKYISGHSDVLLGAVSVKEKWAETLESYYRVLEIFAPSQDCYLALRGLRTLRVRLRQHEVAALKVARWLEEVKLVERVIHPALPSHPQHYLWKRDFTGSSGLFAFIFNDRVAEDEVAEFINRLKLFGIGYSWGGFKSLVTAGKYQRSGTEFTGKTVVRLNIGLEDEHDLIADLQQAFEILH
jgi:cystathionine beta-lyase